MKMTKTAVLYKGGLKEIGIDRELRAIPFEEYFSELATLRWVNL